MHSPAVSPPQLPSPCAAPPCFPPLQAGSRRLQSTGYYGAYSVRLQHLKVSWKGCPGTEYRPDLFYCSYLPMIDAQAPNQFGTVSLNCPHGLFCCPTPAQT